MESRTVFSFKFVPEHCDIEVYLDTGTSRLKIFSSYCNELQDIHLLATMVKLLQSPEQYEQILAEVKYKINSGDNWKISVRTFMPDYCAFFDMGLNCIDGKRNIGFFENGAGKRFGSLLDCSFDSSFTAVFPLENCDISSLISSLESLLKHIENKVQP